MEIWEVKPYEGRGTSLIWIFKKNKDVCTIGIKNEHSQRKIERNDLIYEFSFSIPHNEKLPEKQEIEISKNNELFDVLQEVIIDYFSQDMSLDMDINDQEVSHEINRNRRKKSFLAVYRKILKSEVGQAVENNKEDIVQLLLLQKFIQAAHVLTDPIRVSGISNSERKNISLCCYVLRMYILKLILENCSKGEYPQLQAYVEKAYVEEFKRFCEYLSEESFYGYILPDDDISRFFKKVWNKKELQLDDIVFGTIEEFTKIISVNKTLKKYISKVINGFFLPRYNIYRCLKLQRFAPINLVGWINILLLPRLAASIIIGLLPILLTGELYEWYKSEILNDKGAENWFEFFTGILLILIFGYLFIETHNFLGFNSFKRALTIFLQGLVISLIFVLMTHPFSCYTLKNGCKNITDLPFSLLFLQTTASYFLGIVLQAIWEDKPITQPL
jgi:hypothetical protein